MSTIARANSRTRAIPAQGTANVRAFGGPALPQYRSIPLPVFVLFLGYVVFWYLQGGFRIEPLGKIRFEFLVGSILAVLAIVTLAQTRDSRGPRSGIVGWIATLFVVAILMTAISSAPATSWQVLIDRVVKFAMMALFIAAFVPSPWHLRWFLGAYLLAFAKMAQEGMLGLVSGSLVWENQGTPRLHGPTPGYAHPNSFSGTQLGTVPFLAGLLPLAPRWLKIGLLLQLSAAITIVITTGSRTGYVALMLWLGWLFWHSRSKFKALVLACIGGAILLPFVPSDYFERFETIFTQEDEEGASIEARRQILSDAFTILGEHPLGVGVGAFSLVRQAKFGRHQETHNLYLEVAADMGIQGLIVFLGLLACMLLVAKRVAQGAEGQLRALAQHYDRAQQEFSPAVRSHKSDLLLMRVVAQAVIAFLVIRIGLGFFGHDFYEIYWWFAAGLLIALHNMFLVAKQRTEYLLKTSVESRSSDSTGVPSPSSTRQVPVS